MTRRNISGRSGRKLAKGKTIPEIAEALEEEDTIRQLVEEMGMN